MVFEFTDENKIVLTENFSSEAVLSAQKLGKALTAAGKHIALAESCTGGLAAKLLTDIPGSSTFFECGIVSYSNRIKHEVLGVDDALIEEKGVVSPEVACAMAEAVLKRSGADIGIGITGVAGPGPDGDKPEGEIYIGLADSEKSYVMKLYTETENRRDYNRYTAALNAFNLAVIYLDNEID